VNVISTVESLVHTQLVVLSPAKRNTSEHRHDELAILPRFVEESKEAVALPPLSENTSERNAGTAGAAVEASNWIVVEEPENWE